MNDATAACRNFDQVTADWQGATISMKKTVQVWDVPRLTYHFCVSHTCTGVGCALANISLLCLRPVQVWDVPRLTYHCCVSHACTCVGCASANVSLLCVSRLSSYR